MWLATRPRTPKGFERNWVACDRGYRAVKEICIAVKVPANGYFVEDPYETGWKCDRGYLAVKKVCQAVKIPQNAHLDYTGNEWECNRPFEKKQERCVLP